MIIVDPVALGDVACTRASPKGVCDRTGALVQVPANTLAVTYDPADLTKAPYALVEQEATNQIRNNTMQGAAPGSPGTLPASWQWGTNVGLSYEIARTGIENGVEYIDIRIYGMATGAGFAGVYFEGGTAIAAAIGQVWANSVYCRAAGGSLSNISSVALCIDENNTVPSYVTGASAALKLDGPLFPRSRGTYVHTVAGVATAYILPHIKLFTRAAGAVDLTLRIGLPQTERDCVTSVIKTTPTFTGRATDANYWNSAGALTNAAVNVERVSYSPANLGAAPNKLYEAAATNVIRNSTMQGALAGDPGTLPTNWGFNGNGGLSRQVVGNGVEDGIDYIDVRVFGTASSVATSEMYFNFDVGTTAVAGAGQTWASSLFVRMVGGTMAGVADFENFIIFYNSAGTLTEAGSNRPTVDALPLRVGRKAFVLAAANQSTAYVQNRFDVNLTPNAAVDITLRIGLPQLERNAVTSPIKTTNAIATRAADVITSTPVTRAADVIGAGAGLVYSNVPITEPNYDVAATYGKGAVVHDPATHNLFESILATNKGRALTDVGAWTPRGATSRWAMLDQYNNTQTTAADEILIVVSPEAISQGLYVGNTYADEVRVSVVDQVEGVVYRETAVLLESNSESSFFNWFFKRIKRRDYFVTLAMPPYANALITVSLRKVGGTARCGMCAIGPTDEFGPTLMGLSTEGKDYSSTTFNFDGTSNTVVRPYAKKMTCDVLVDNRQIDYLQARLFELRQKPIVWVGGPYGITAVFGRYASFKNVIQYVTYSSMNLTIEGAV